MEPYVALFEPDRKTGGYVVTFPDFGYGVTQGETDQEAMDMAQDLLMLTIGDFVRESKPLPKPKRHRGSKFRSVDLPALQAAKVDLYELFLLSGHESGIRASHRNSKNAYRAVVFSAPSLAFGSDGVGIRRAWQTPPRRGAGCSLN